MASLPISKIILSNKNYYKLITNTFQKYVYVNFEDLHFLKII